MKKVTAAFMLFYSVAFTASTQNIGINTTGSSADACAILDIAASDKGLLIPRVSLVSRTDVVTVPNPVTSLLVYNTNAAMTNACGEGYYYWDGDEWVCINISQGNLNQTHGRRLFSSAGGVYFFTIPLGVAKVWVSGSGGGGGGGLSSGVNFAGAGGGGGTACRDSVIAVTAGQVISIQVGAGGGPGAAGLNTTCSFTIPLLLQGGQPGANDGGLGGAPGGAGGAYGGSNGQNAAIPYSECGGNGGGTLMGPGAMGDCNKMQNNSAPVNSGGGGAGENLAGALAGSGGSGVVSIEW